MTGAGVTVDAIMAAAARARQACEDRDRRHGVREPDRERQEKSPDILRRLPRFLRHETSLSLEARVSSQQLREAANWWHWNRGNLVLMGPSGCGKSTAAAIVVRRMVDRGVAEGGFCWTDALGIWWFAAGELERARREHPLGQGEAPEVVKACSARLLVIDDAGWDRDPAPVSHVLDQRMQSARPTIITTGLTPGELSGHYGAAVIRRIVEAGGRKARVVDCFAPEVESRPDSKTRAAGVDR